MADRYPIIEPYESGMLEVGGGHRIAWEVSGNPSGKAAVALHGGPGSGRAPGWRRFFDPAVYRIVLFDQRGCGRSTPNAGDPATDLADNTTHHLIADMERLREHLGIDRWLVFGGSWGTTLALAYAEQVPERVSEMILFSITTTTAREVEWLTVDAGRFFPEQWERFRDAVPPALRCERLVDAYASLLADPDPAVRDQAARDWCAWEDAHVAVTPGHRPNPRYEDPAFRMTFTRLVTHYWRHAAWIPEGRLIREASRLAGIPGVLLHGRLDVSSPPDVAWALARSWHGSVLTILDDGGHGLGHERAVDVIVTATDRFAAAS
jgi:proline iminopeptidase